MTIKRIEIEYEDGSLLTLTSHQLAAEFVRFVASLRTESKVAEHDVQWHRCPRCNATGRIGSDYCGCQMGRDLRVVEKHNYIENTAGGMDGEPESDTVETAVDPYSYTLEVDTIMRILRRSALGLVADEQLRQIAREIVGGS